MTSVYPEIMDWRIGGDSEFTDFRRGVFPRDREPYAHRLGPFWRLDLEFIFILERRVAWLRPLQKTSAEHTNGDSYCYAGHQETQKDGLAAKVRKIHTFLLVAEVAPMK
jgi:hypothetical protein